MKNRQAIVSLQLQIQAAECMHVLRIYEELAKTDLYLRKKALKQPHFAEVC